MKEERYKKVELTEIRDLYRNTEQYADKEVTVGGWVRSNRDSKTFGFIVINDGTFLNLCRSYTATDLKILKQYPN